MIFLRRQNTESEKSRICTIQMKKVVSNRRYDVRHLNGADTAFCESENIEYFLKYCRYWDNVFIRMKNYSHWTILDQKPKISKMLVTTIFIWTAERHRGVKRDQGALSPMVGTFVSMLAIDETRPAKIWSIFWIKIPTIQNWWRSSLLLSQSPCWWLLYGLKCY